MSGVDRDYYKKYYIGERSISNCMTPAIKIWSNGIPLKADTYKSCTNFCSYCFARALTAGMVERAGVKYNPRIARTVDNKEIARWFERANKEKKGFMFWAMRNKYFIELGTLSEVFQEADVEMRATWNFLQLMAAYKMPLFINTKGNLLVHNDNYFRLMADYPAPVIMSVSLVSHEDTGKLEPGAPTSKERLELIKRLREVGIPTVVYTSPVMPGYTDTAIEDMVGALVEAGAVGAHVRNFYIVGKLEKMRRWKRYLEEHKEVFTTMGRGRKVKAEYMSEIYIRMQEAADKLDPRFRVVGMKSHWFDLNPVHGKLAIDWLPEKFKDGFMDFSAIPILRKIREKMDEPQLLLWSEIGYKRDLINTPYAIPLGASVGEESGWLIRGCKSTMGGKERSRGIKDFVSGWSWVKDALWNGMNYITPTTGFIEDITHIFTVTENGHAKLDEKGDRVYAYIPDAFKDLISDGHVPWSTARDFIIPKRLGGTEDKFWPVESSEIYDLGDRWKG